MLKENLIEVNKRWKAQSLKLANPLSERLLIENFTNRGILLSKDVVKVYLNIGGFDEDDMDSECLTFWTVEKILCKNKLNAEKMCFADFLIGLSSLLFQIPKCRKLRNLC